MDYKAYQNRLSKLTARLNLMVFLVFGLLIANISLSTLTWYTWSHRTIEITPFSANNGYQKSNAQVDSRYLSLMAENFIYSRFNITPETVEANHKRLLEFVNSKSYPSFLRLLNKEAKIIRSKKMSSVFDITAIQVNPNQLTAKVSGILKRYVGLRELRELQVTYLLEFAYTNGRLSIIQFSPTKEGEHA
jgi:conjugal transfer pilus assembly protein TraE